ncbi:BREX-1 system adenine-specific DNA-methyltransferase PglX [Cryobacterium glaciale]|uniref:site-specific DNA-methyltransferase (adenine-specific) n=1 Tax=Cryobacterium glaciale TaxID=1259145 RepID=A0A4R8UVZ8_9MICO|nr:BREX-1 system adenine-specific DNA-methyltransferase PglX [Cryobacterium glaciale]TFB71536.1 BREX-1 system adenine-specific DNA-methyltransferase PglX [Cryobacterium glaciale]
MDTKPLERFATWARRELINAVDAQTTAVLAVGSIARSERAEIVKKLEAEIGRHGRQNIVDKVAYTWFNRIIALRFMDARGYTDAGVVSPAQGQAHGQPEILSDAKRGNLDTDVVTTSRTANAIIGLLDGTRRSTDAEGEAYALLLTEYCRHWHKPMPFMFEREGDYTELLVPANLLADGAILARAREVLTEDVCNDVEVIGWLYQFYVSERKHEVFDGFKAKGKARKLAGSEEIPAATQLFTPHWIVRYLVENSVGRLWMLNRPSSRLVDQMEYYIAPADDDPEFLKISKPEELTVIDPACGSGHMLTYAFDLLYAIYEEEGYAPSEIPGLILTHNLHGTEIDPRAGSLAAFALTMKARAKQRAFFNKQVEPRICVIEPMSFGPEALEFLARRGGNRQEEEAFWNQFDEADTFGSLLQPDPALTFSLATHLKSLNDNGDILKSDAIQWANRVLAQAEYLTARYSVAVANPPYMGSKNMAAMLVAFAQDRYPDSKADLFAMFIERCQNLVSSHGGLVAMITMHSWMFLASFEKLRAKLLRDAPPTTMAHLGERAFDSIGGSVVSTTAFVLQMGRGQANEGVYLRLIDGRNEAEKAASARIAIKGLADQELYRVQPRSFIALPGAPLAYWFPATLLEAFRTAPSLDTTARAAKGLVTADNATFVRQWWETSRSRIGFGYADRASAKTSGMRWFPYAKGGDFRRWAGNLEAVVNWEKDGHLIQTTLTDDGSRVRATNFNLDRIFKPSIAWTVVTTNDPSFRKVEAGYLFDAAAGLCQSTDDDYTLALLNSSSVKQVLAGLNPTMNLHPGYLSAVPAPADNARNTVRTAATRAVELSQKDWTAQERSWDFESSPLVGRGPSLPAAIDDAQNTWSAWVTELHLIEQQNDLHFAKLFGFDGEVEAAPMNRVSLAVNPSFTYLGLPSEQARNVQRDDAVRDLVSFAVGCMFGRYSLDAPGLILADQGTTLKDYLTKVPAPSFMPDADNVIPFVDDGWFEDDIVERFRQFLRAAFGSERFEENLRFVEESLGVKTLREYFITKAGKSKFYDDHVQRYKKRPIYWMFSSPKGSFNALIYMHRYTPSTVSTVLNEYLREYRAKLEVALANAEHGAARDGAPKDQKDADQLRKVLAELRDYEHDVLYPLATQQPAIDLDDGVKANYPKFYPALKKITGLEAAE